MGRAARHVLTITLVLGVLAVPARLTGQDGDIGGVYVSQGINPDGTEYQGFVHIVRHGESFVVSWMFPHMSDEVLLLERNSVGVGIVSDGTLAVSYYSPRMLGVAVYRIDKAGQRLTGHWTVAGDDGAVYSETLTKLPDDLPEPAVDEPPAGTERARPQDTAVPPGALAL